MATHLSARIAWHDSAWNGTVCRQPSCNTSCIVHDYIRDVRNDARENDDAGQPLPELDGYLPPCSYEASTYASIGYVIEHRDPVEERGLTTYQFQSDVAQRAGMGKAAWRRRAMQRRPRVNQEVRLRATFLGCLGADLASAGKGWRAWSHRPVETAQ